MTMREQVTRAIYENARDDQRFTSRFTGDFMPWEYVKEHNANSAIYQHAWQQADAAITACLTALAAAADANGDAGDIKADIDGGPTYRHMTFAEYIRSFLPSQPEVNDGEG